MLKNLLSLRKGFQPSGGVVRLHSERRSNTAWTAVDRFAKVQKFDLEAFAVSAYFCMPTHCPNAFALYHPNLLIALVHRKHYWSSVIAFSSMLLDHKAFPNSVAHIKMCPKSKVLCWIVSQSKGWEKSGIDMDLPNSPSCPWCSGYVPGLFAFLVSGCKEKGTVRSKAEMETWPTAHFCSAGDLRRLFCWSPLWREGHVCHDCRKLQYQSISVFTEKGTG